MNILEVEQLLLKCQEVVVQGRGRCLLGASAVLQSFANQTRSQLIDQINAPELLDELGSKIGRVNAKFAVQMIMERLGQTNDQ